MKKFIKIILIAIVVIFALLLIIPVAFKGKILQIAQNEINKNLNAKVEFADLRLSLIRNFPNLSVSLVEMSVVGVGDFESDTLVAFKTFRAVVDIKSAISGDAISVRSILLDQPRVKAKVLEDGRANWDIMAETEDAEPSVPADPQEESAAFSVDLQRFEINDGDIEYDDVPMALRTTIGGLNLLMHGDLSQDLTSLDIAVTSEIFNLWFDGIRFISNAGLTLNTLLDADMNNFRFTFRENEMKLNELTVGMEGYFAMPESGMDMDINFYSTNTDFLTILSLIPAIYMADFQDLTARGSLSLEGFVRGAMTDEMVPSVGLDLVVENAGFSYPDLPGSLDNLQMDLNLYYDGADDDLTTIDLRRFHMEMAGNPFDMTMSIRTPMSDMQLDAAITGTIDFTSFADVIPLEGIALRGLLESDISLSGNMSDIENERYEDFNAGGSMRLTAFQYSDSAFPLGVSIPNAVLDFSPRFVELSSFEMMIGGSDMRLNGRMENFIPYIFNDGTIRGTMTFTSTMLDLNEIMAVETEEVETDTVPLSIVEVPANIDFVLVSTVDNIFFDNMEITNLQGRIIVRDKRVVMEEANMNMLGGSILVDGEYNTQDMSVPFIDFAMDISNFDIPSSFHTFNTVQRLTPLARDLRGSFSTSMKMNALLDEEMMPVMNSIDASGRLLTSSVEVVSSTTFDRLSSALSLREDRENVLRDLDISFTIADGRVYLEPFETRLGPIGMVIGGDQGVDQTMNYVMRMTVPRSLFGSGADQVINNLVSSAAARGLNIQPGDNVNLDATITGTFADPQISLNMMESARSSIENVMEQVRTQAAEEVERRVEQVEDRVREEVTERADKILEEAEKRAEQIRKAAAEAAERVRKEGGAAADKIEQEASGRGMIAEAAAKRTADGIRREANQKADDIIREANERADKILEDAKREAGRLE